MLNKLPSPKSKAPKMRIGRGMSSGKGGHTSTRGGKGQTARTGHNAPRSGFEGGQMPLSRRLPQLRGVSQKSARSSRRYFDTKVRHYVLQLSQVAAAAVDGKVSIEQLIESGLVKPALKAFTIKVLFDAPIKEKISFAQLELSEKARKAVEEAGGEVLE